jgi:hypothetical protein
MQINLIAILVIVILAGLCYYANNALNNVPVLKNVINVIIVVVSVLMILQSTGLLGSTHSTIIV